MFVKVHKPVNTPCVCDNKDRCRALVEYLLKESLEDKPYYDTFFSHEEDYVPPVTVIQKIDNNHKKLMKGDDKFYMLSINPSQDVNPEKPDVPLNKNDAFQKVQKRRVQEKR